MVNTTYKVTVSSHVEWADPQSSDLSGLMWVLPDETYLKKHRKEEKLKKKLLRLRSIK